MAVHNMGHYGGTAIAVDPHRIISSSKRTMPKKKKQPGEPSKKMLRTFFAASTKTGQPIGCGIGSAGVNTTRATIELLELVDKTVHGKALVLAKTKFQFRGKSEEYRLIVQREGAKEPEYGHRSSLTISDTPATTLMSERYGERWSIEEFFNFDGAMGFDRASTFNLNVRYGKMSLALLVQAATYQFRQKLPGSHGFRTSKWISGSNNQITKINCPWKIAEIIRD